MRVIDWLGRIFKPPREGIYRTDSYRAEAEERMAIDAYALFTVVHLIANLLSVCEYRTYRNGREVFGAEWASLNVRPNHKQNAADWKRELVARLLLSGEMLCIQQRDGQLIIAEAFSKAEKSITKSVFSQISRDGFTLDRSFTSDDVLYLQTPVNARSAWLQQTMMEYEKLMRSAAERLRNAGGERGVVLCK